MPQLSSAELAWSVDTQELFIGNGSLVEGAPYVGNTKILTEHDNILELASSYRFASDDRSIYKSVSRSLQSKIDEIEVSILDFGPPPDPSTDQTPTFTKAFEQLFQNTDTRYRKVLVVPNGYYNFKSVLKIPSYVILRGETRDGVVLDVNSRGIAFLSDAGTDQLGFTSTDRPEDIRISNLTISYTTVGVDLYGLKDSYFENVKWSSGYVLGDIVESSVLASQSYDLSTITAGGYIRISSGNLGVIITTPVPTDAIGFTTNSVTTVIAVVDAFNNNGAYAAAGFIASRSAESLVITSNKSSASVIRENFTVSVQPTSAPLTNVITPVATEASSGIENVPAAVFWTNTQFGIRTNKVQFIDCKWESTALAVKCIQTVDFETVINFTNCEFFVCNTGILISGISDNVVHDWLVKDCHFEEVAKQAVVSTGGTGMKIDRATFKNVANGVNGSASPSSYIVDFKTPYGNIVVDAYSDRHQASGISLLSTAPGFAESRNSVVTRIANSFYSSIYFSDTFSPLSVFDALNRYIVIDYVLTLYNNVRKGKLTLAIDTTLTEIAIADNYTYSSPYQDDRLNHPGGIMMTNFEFNAELISNKTADDSTGRVIDTVLLTYKNPLTTGSTGTITYSITYGV